MDNPEKLLLPYLVGLVAAYKEDGTPGAYLYSGFCVEIEDTWIFVSAGHCMAAVKFAIENENQYENVATRLVDRFHSEASCTKSIPISLEGRIHFADTKGAKDFGFFVLREMEKQALQVNKIEAFPIRNCYHSKLNGFDYDQAFVLGFPERRSDIDLKRKIGFAEAWCLEVCDIELEESGFLTGRIEVPNNSFSVKGMSGGPIVGFASEDGVGGFAPIALQGSWNERDKIFGVHLFPFMDAILKQIADARE